MHRLLQDKSSRRYRLYLAGAVIIAIIIGFYLTKTNIVSPIPGGSGIEVIIVSPIPEPGWSEQGTPAVGGTEVNYGDPAVN